VHFDERDHVILDVLADALQVDLTGARPDTPLQVFSIDHGDWIVILGALDAQFPGSGPAISDSDVEMCVTLGDLVERVDVR
jgi:hypothetical protein